MPVLRPLSPKQTKPAPPISRPGLWALFLFQQAKNRQRRAAKQHPQVPIPRAQVPCLSAVIGLRLLSPERHELLRVGVSEHLLVLLGEHGASPKGDGSLALYSSRFGHLSTSASSTSDPRSRVRTGAGRKDPPRDQA